MPPPLLQPLPSGATTVLLLVEPAALFPALPKAVVRRLLQAILSPTPCRASPVLVSRTPPSLDPVKPPGMPATSVPVVNRRDSPLPVTLRSSMHSLVTA